MIRVIVTPSAKQNIYGLMVKKEVALRKKNQGTLHRSAGKQFQTEKWAHASYPGWIRFEQALGGVVVAQVQSKTPEQEWQLLSSLIGFLDRHFRAEIGTVMLTYGDAT